MNALKTAILALLAAALWSLPGRVQAQVLFVGSENGGGPATIGKYDPASGAAINGNFITNLPLTFGLACSGNTLYATSYGSGVGTYDATTGAAINVNFVTGLNSPVALALSGNSLYVVDNGDNTVGQYDATTGAAINASLITGLNGPLGIALSGNNLFVTNLGNGTVGEYDATTGAPINVNFITGLASPFGLALQGNVLFVSTEFGGDGGTVGEYDATTGTAINANFIVGLNSPTGLLLSGNNLFVASTSAGTVGEYDATSGAAINASLIPGLPGPIGLTFGAYPEIAVEQPAGTGLASGSTQSIAAVQGTATNLTFTIKNVGVTNLTGLAITTDGANAADFTVTTNPTAPVVPGGSTTFTVQFTASAGGTETAAIHIASNAASNNPFDIDFAASPDLGSGGPLTGDLTVSGVLSPGGTSAGSLSVGQALTLESTATTEIDLGGTSPVSTYDTIAVAGAVTLDGTLQLNVLNGYENQIVNGDSFTIISGASITGTFAGLPDGSRISLPGDLGSVVIHYTATTVTLSGWQPVIHELTWDPGTADAGTQVFSNTDTRAGRQYFHIQAQATDIGAWKTRLTVASGEADLYMLDGSIPQTIYNYNYKSDRVGSDGIMLSSNQYNVGHDWYIMVNATDGAQWSLFTGRAWVQDLGTLAWTDTNVNGIYDIGEPVLPSGTGGNVTLGPEGIRFFRNVVPTGTPAWSLWLNGDTRPIAVEKDFVPFPGVSYDRQQNGQMLVVAPYLAGVTSTYFLAVTGDPGDEVNLDSRIQVVSDVRFGTTGDSVDVTAAPYRVYRVQVPIQQIAWEVRTIPSAGDASVCVRRDNVPAEFDNDAFSEVAGGVENSITLVPDFLSDGTWFITVYGTSPYSFQLRNGQPTITDLNFVGTQQNDETNRAGWRYYKLSDIQSQLGSLGWELDLASQVPGTEIAIRRNAVPSQWNSRTGGSPYVTSDSRVDDSGTGGFLQQPGHQADIWYVGVYTPDAPLGAFTLTSGPMVPTVETFDGGQQTFNNQAPGRWQYVRVDVPSGVLGWDLRLTGVSGAQPQMVIERDQLPQSTGYSPYYWYPYTSTSWPTGYSWPQQLDWTGDYYTIGDPTYAVAPPRLVMGMGRPLEAGTYYVGVYNPGYDPQSGYGATSSYTIDSRGIGAAGSGLTYQVTDPPLAYAGGTATITNLAPREAQYFKVTIPPNTPSWEVTLDPSAGEMLLAVRRGTIPDFNASSGGGVEADSNGQPQGGVETKMQKAGPERYVMLPENGETYLPADDYYLAVVSEGVNPGNSVSGTGTSSGTLTSQGPLAVTPLGDATNAGLTQAVSLVGGQVQAFTFNVPPGTNSLEVRLDNPTGTPAMAIYPGNVIPSYPYDPYGIDGGGGGYGVSPIFTQANPTTGTWTVLVQAGYDSPSGTYAPATANLVFTALTPQPVNFDGGTALIASQPPGSWRYFQFTVPDGIMGWDLRLTGVSGAQPQMVIERDELPQSTGYYPYYWYPSYSTTWPTGYSWPQQLDWTGDYYTIGDPTYAVAPPRLVMGMGRPLQAGTYYVGVYNPGYDPQSGVYGATSSYTIDSRGIGAAGSGLTYQVTDPPLAYAGGTATITNLAPREAQYFKVTIPPNTPSWEVTLDPSAGEMLLAVRRGTIPDFNASSGGAVESDSNGQPQGGVETKMQKAGSERYVMLPENGETYLPADDYYLAVVSEGVNPGNSVSGTGTSSGTLTSQGPLVVTPLGDATNAGLTQAVSLVGGQVQAFTFNVPVGTNSLEVRLDNPTGTPAMAIYPGNVIPSYPYDPYGIDGGGSGYYVNPIFTQANPTTGTWTVLVQAGYDSPSGTYAPATANLVFTALTPQPVNFDGGTALIASQPPGSWRYFQFTVPDGIMGWDLRLTGVSGAQPQMVIERDELPQSTGYYPYYWYPSYSTTWPTGYSWPQQLDWTGDYYTIGDPTYAVAPPRLVMGMGRPLQAGTYYVGVYNPGYDPQSGVYGATSSYTIDSRGIGAAGSGLTYQVTDPPLAYAGGTATITNLAPREAQYFKVTIPPNTPSWEVTLDPSAGEMLLAVRRGTIPDFNASSGGAVESDSNGQPQGGVETKMQKAGSERYVMLPENGETYLPADDYYLAVVSEGVNPGNSVSGTGTSSGTLTSKGPLVVTPLGDATNAGLTQAVSLVGGQVQAFTFNVPPGTNSLEVRLDNPTGVPVMNIYPGNVIPSYPYDGYGIDGGGSGYYVNPIFTQANPTTGTWTVLVQAGYDYSSGTYTPATANLVVQQRQNVTLGFDASLNGNGSSNTDSRQMIDGQYNIYQVAVPASVPLIVNGQPVLDVNGQPVLEPVLGWSIHTDVLQGSVSLQIYNDFTNPDGGLNLAENTAVVVPPYLTSATTWYVRVHATGLTNYTITSTAITESTLERAVWEMPTDFNLDFGDSGVDGNGFPLPGDQGIDLAQGEWHFYAVDVPDGNAGLLRTELDAISGNSNLYIRETGVPTTDHSAYGPLYYGGPLYDRSLTATTTQYGNWVPLDGKSQKQLTPGRWYLGVKAAGNSNVRYRLKVSTGRVTDLALDPSLATDQVPASVSNQILADNDWRYYRFTVPADAPNNWTLTFGQQVGDVVMWLRDNVPPGQGSYNYAGGYVESWASDNKNQGPYSYSGYDAAGVYPFTTPPLRPGSTYFVGFRSNNSATFSLNSATSGGSISALPVLGLEFYAGTINTTIPANSSLVYEIPVPPEATRMKWTATNDNTVDIRLEQGTLPGLTGSQHWDSNGNIDVVFNQPLNATTWPWLPSQNYYLRLVNTTDTPAPVTLTMNGQNALTEDPLVALLPVTNLMSTGATLNGTANPNGTATDVFFDYGPDANYGTTVYVPISPYDDRTDHLASLILTGLTPGTQYHYRLRAINQITTAVTVDATFVTLTPIQQWRQDHFGTTTNNGIAADTATPDYDGIPNLTKYGLGIVPGYPGSTSLPTVQIVSYAEGQRLTIFFTRDPSHTDLLMSVEAADDPSGPWTPVATSTGGGAFSGAGFVSETDAGGGLKAVQVRDTVNSDAAAHRYLHVKISD